MFGSKSQGVFIDVVGDTAHAARVSGFAPPFVIEDLREIPVSDPTLAANIIRMLSGSRGSGYATAVCGVYPANRVVTRLPIEPRKIRDEGYLAAHVSETLKIKAESYSLIVLSPTEGTDAFALKTPPKEVLLCGAPAEEFGALQNRLLEIGLYPARMELGTIATLGGLKSYMAFSDAKAPTLLLEIGDETTSVFVLSRDGVEVSRNVAFGINSMIPLVQRELGLKDEESARKLFFSDNFDFTGMGTQLTKRLIRELQPSIGFYEVQTGVSIGQLRCTLLPSKVSWLQQTLADLLGMKVMPMDFAVWLRSMGIASPERLNLANLSPVWTGLFCLIGEYRNRDNEAAA